MMIGVVIAALCFYGMRERKHRLALASLCGIAAQGVRHTGASYRLESNAETLRTVTAEAPARTPSEIERRRRRSAYWIDLKQKYTKAAAWPWLPVRPDPPEPE